MIIRNIAASDLDFAASLTTNEGWDSETRLELEGLFTHDPGGCLIAEIDGQRAGMCMATGYASFAFVGELIVVPDLRGAGIGRQLLESAIAYLRLRGLRAIYLDGVLAAVPLYERLGYKRVCRSWRFSGALCTAQPPGVFPMRAADLDSVAQLDRTAFGADRRFFLERRLRLFPELCKVKRQGGAVAAYLMGRRGRTGVSVGPWVVAPGVENPGALLESLAAELGGAPLRIGVLETNPQAIATLESLGFEKSQSSPWRMLLGENDSPGDPSLAYAIGSPAKG